MRLGLADLATSLVKLDVLDNEGTGIGADEPPLDLWMGGEVGEARRGEEGWVGEERERWRPSSLRNVALPSSALSFTGRVDDPILSL